jgi:hypothetical protein
MGMIGRGQRTSMMHDVPRDFLHQLLEHDLGEFRWKDILDKVRIAFSDFVTYAQYWLRATMCDRLWGAVDCGSHVRVANGENDAHVVTLLHFKSTLRCYYAYSRYSRRCGILSNRNV